MKRIGRILLAILMVALLLEGRYFLTAGFVPKKIVYRDYYQKRRKTSSDFLEKHPKIFDQQFFYLNKGRQSYVFESADKKYVLKLIRYHKYQDPFWAEILSYLQLLSSSKKKILEERKNRYKNAFNSYKIAYEELADITKVVYVHLNPTENLKKRITIKNKLGIPYSIDLDEVVFIIQEKTEPLLDALLRLKKEHQKETIKKMLVSFFDALVLKTNKNIISHDFPNIIRNSGYKEGRFVELDVGSFSKVQDKERKKKEFFHLSDQLRNFLHENFPEYLLFFEAIKKEKFTCIAL